METTRKPKSPLKRLLIGCALGLGAFVVVGGGLIAFFYYKYVDFGDAASKVEADLAAYQAAGMPWEAKDVSLSPAPANQNAAPLIRTAEASVEQRGRFANTTEIREDLEAKKLDAAGNLLAAYTPDLALVEKAASLPRLDYGRDWDAGPVQSFPEMESVKMFVRLFGIRAEYNALRHAPKEAVRNIQTAWKLSLLGGQESGIVSMLEQVGCQNIVFGAIERCAAASIQDPATLQQLDAVIDRPADLPNFGKALRGEAYLGIATIRNPETALKTVDDEFKASASKIDKSKLVRTGIPTDVKLRGMMARHLEVWTQIKAAIDKYSNDTDELQQAIAGIAEDWSHRTTVSFMLSSVTLGPFAETGIAVTEQQAQWKTTRALLAAMRIKATTGKWPTRIEQLPGSWSDPFSGAPLKVKQSGDSIRIYSVGPNRKDDGGIRKSEIKDDSKAKDYDIVASYPPRHVRKAT